MRIALVVARQQLPKCKYNFERIEKKRPDRLSLLTQTHWVTVAVSRLKNLGNVFGAPLFRGIS